MFYRTLSIMLIANLWWSSTVWAKFTCAANQVLVTESTSRSYKVGKCFAKNYAFKLEKGERLVVQRWDGQTQAVNGYYSVNDLLKQGLVNLIEAFVNAISQRAPAQDIELWAIDATADSVFCFKPAQELFLQRTQVGDTETVMFIDSTKGKSLKYHWLVDRPRLSWPKELPVMNGATYLIQVGEEAPRELTFYQVTEQWNGNELAAWMETQGCERQTKKFLRIWDEQVNQNR